MSSALLTEPASTMRIARPVSMLPSNDLDTHVTTRPVSMVSTVSAPASARGSRSAVNQYKCVVVGDGGVGKTSMLLRFVQGDFSTEYQPTHFDSFTGKQSTDLNSQQVNNFRTLPALHVSHVHTSIALLVNNLRTATSLQVNNRHTSTALQLNNLHNSQT